MLSFRFLFFLQLFHRSHICEHVSVPWQLRLTWSTQRQLAQKYIMLFVSSWFMIRVIIGKVLIGFDINILLETFKIVWPNLRHALFWFLTLVITPCDGFDRALMSQWFPIFYNLVNIDRSGRSSVVIYWSAICILLNDKLEAWRIRSESLRLVVWVDIGIVVFIGAWSLMFDCFVCLLVSSIMCNVHFLLFLAWGSWILWGEFLAA